MGSLVYLGIRHDDDRTEVRAYDTETANKPRILGFHFDWGNHTYLAFCLADTLLRDIGWTPQHAKEAADDFLAKVVSRFGRVWILHEREIPCSLQELHEMKPRA
jgi:hypothetical protein